MANRIDYASIVGNAKKFGLPGASIRFECVEKED